MFQWNHDEFAYSRLKDHVPDHVAWLLRSHSIDTTRWLHLVDDRDRDYNERYFTPFRRDDQGTKSPYTLPVHRSNPRLRLGGRGVAVLVAPERRDEERHHTREMYFRGHEP